MAVVLLRTKYFVRHFLNPDKSFYLTAVSLSLICSSVSRSCPCPGVNQLESWNEWKMLIQVLVPTFLGKKSFWGLSLSGTRQLLCILLLHDKQTFAFLQKANLWSGEILKELDKCFTDGLEKDPQKTSRFHYTLRDLSWNMLFVLKHVLPSYQKI